MAFVKGTHYKEIEAPKWNFTGNKTTVTRTLLLLDSRNVEDFALTLLGTASTGGGQIQRIPPARYPGKNHLVCVGISTNEVSNRNIDWDTTGESYNDEGIVCAVRYETVPWSLNQGDADQQEDNPAVAYYTERLTGRSEVVTRPKSSVQWELNNDATSKAVEADLRTAYRVSIVTYEVSWHRVPQPNWTALINNQGCRNDAVWLGFPKYTVLYDTFTGFRSSDPAGDRLWELQLVFHIRVIEQFGKVGTDSSGDVTPGWGFFPRGKPGATQKMWQQLVDSGAGNEPIVPSATFDDIFKAAT